MTDWFVDTPESARLLAEERLIVSVTESISEVMDDKDISKTALADSLGITKSEISQRLSSRRNLTLRTLADIAYVLDVEVCVELRPCHSEFRGMQPVGGVMMRQTDWPVANSSYVSRGRSDVRLLPPTRTA